MALNLQCVNLSDDTKKKKIQHILEQKADCCVATWGTAFNAVLMFECLLEKHIWINLLKCIYFIKF